MLDAVIKIGRIDYAETIRNIFPIVSDKMKGRTFESTASCPYHGLESAALPVMIGVAKRLPEDTKTELAVRDMNAAAPALREKLNDRLRGEGWGQYVSVGKISAERRDGILLKIGQIEADYAQLLRDERVTEAVSRRLGSLSALAAAAAGTAAAFGSHAAERAAVELLRQENIKKRLLELAGEILYRYGFRLDVEDILLMQTESNPDTADAAEDFSITEKMEKDLMDAFSAYLRDAEEEPPEEEQRGGACG